MERASRHVASIAGRLSLRPPQRRSLELLDRLTAIVPPRKDTDVRAALEAVRAEFPSVEDFEREFVSVCFALATGVGKTRLMGACIAYLHLAHGLDNFFVLAPNLTIHDKLVADFTPNTPKYVFRGIPEFAVEPPEVVTGDNYESRAGSFLSDLTRCTVNIFNISKINSEVRGGRSPRIKRLSEYIGQSYFEYLAGLPDLVLLMDESHRYRAAAGMRAINELRPVLGLELTATPFVETPRGPVPFRNVIYDYPLGRAMEDGFVKEPAVVTRRNFSAAGMTPDALDRLKLEDGVRLHEATKVELETYARSAGAPVVKPFLLVIARDTTHAAQIVRLVESDDFFGGRYAGRAIQVDSSRSGAEEEAMVSRLLRVEHPDEPTEIVVHVNMLKEGWDVTNLYTIVPLRAANARILIEQSIGRGLRLPYGRRTGVDAVDRLHIVAHDRFQEIVDEARRPDSPIRMRSIVLDPAELERRTRTVLSQPAVLTRLGIEEATPGGDARGGHVAPDGPWRDTTGPVRPAEPPAFTDPQERAVARIAYEVITRLTADPARVPTSAALSTPDVQAEIVRAVEERYARSAPMQTALGSVVAPPDVRAVVARTAEVMVGQTIDIPRILVIPRGDGRSGYRPFTLDLSGLRPPAPDDELWIQHLRTGQIDRFTLHHDGVEERRPEDYVVSGLADFDDVSYEEHADLLYDLAGQVVAHLRSYLPDEDDVRRVLRFHQRRIAQFVHAQMQPHHERSASDYDVKVTRGVTELKPSAYTAAVREPIAEYRVAPADRGNMKHYLFGGFTRCLYPYQKFDSDAERKLAVILERESLKWFRPARGQFQLFYEFGGAPHEYQPDFVAETSDEILMLEPKMRTELTDRQVLAKTEAATLWCARATAHADAHGGKPWRYVLIPHDAIAENMTLATLVRRFSSTGARRDVGPV